MPPPDGAAARTPGRRRPPGTDSRPARRMSLPLPGRDGGPAAGRPGSRPAACPGGSGPTGVLAWPHDRARGPDQALRREAGGQQPHVHRQTWPGDGFPRAERGRQVDDDAHDARARPAHRRERPYRRKALRPPEGTPEVHRRPAGRQGHARRPQRLQPSALPRAEQRHPEAASGRGPRHRGPHGGGAEEGQGVLARHGTTARDRRRAAGRPADPDVRRAGQRSRPRGHPLDPQPDEVARGPGPYGLRLLPPDERDGADRRAPRGHRTGATARRHLHGRLHRAELTVVHPHPLPAARAAARRAARGRGHRRRVRQRGAGGGRRQGRADRRAGRAAPARTARAEPPAGLPGGGVHAADRGVGGVPRARRHTPRGTGAPERPHWGEDWKRS